MPKHRPVWTAEVLDGCTREELGQAFAALYAEAFVPLLARLLALDAPAPGSKCIYGGFAVQVGQAGDMAYLYSSLPLGAGLEAFLANMEESV